MQELAVAELMALAGFVIGAGLGATARWAEFCTLGAVADLFLAGDGTRLRSWALAIAVALAGTQALDGLGLIDLSGSIYLSASFGWLGAILGGLCFGLGMALVGTCGYGSLVRLGGGDLRSLVVVLVLGIFAYMTLSGLLGVLRVTVIEPTNIDLSAAGSQALPDLLALVGGPPAAALRWLLAGLAVAALLLFAFRDPAFREAPRAILGGLLIGLLVTAGWLATGLLGADPFEPARLESLTFVSPIGDSLVYAMTSTGSRLDFGIGTVLGAICGAWAVSRAKGEFRFESFDSARQMLRQLGGAALMGFGGVTALGCTVGQGITGLSTLALSAPLALASIFLGAYAGLSYLISGELFGLGRRSRAG